MSLMLDYFKLNLKISNLLKNIDQPQTLANFALITAYFLRL